MAQLTSAELDDLRQRLAAVSQTVTWTKPQVNTALQALEDWFDTSGRNAAGAAIEAVLPGVFTNAQKKAIGKYWMFQKSGRE
jgi:hypothetical protein